MTSIFEGLKAWQAAVVLAVLAGIGGGVYAGYAAVTGSGNATAEVGETSIPVQRGDLVLQVTTDGNITYPRTEIVEAEISGKVGEVLVEEGDTVSVGDAIARLSDRDRADLESALAAARLDVAEARDALAAELDPVDPLVVAGAQAKVYDTRQDLEAAIDALAELQDTGEMALAATRLAAAEAEVRLGNAHDALSDLIADPDEFEVSAAITGLRLAQEALVNEQGRADGDEADRAEAKTAAVEDVAESVAEYGEVFELWLGVNPFDVAGVDLAATEPGAVLDALGADLAVLFDPSAITAELGFKEAAGGLPVDDLATAWDELTVFTWLSLFPGTVAITVDDGNEESGTRYVADELDAAWNAVLAANEALDDLDASNALARTASDGRLENAKRGVELASTALDDLLAAAGVVDVEAAVQRVAFAEAEETEARDALASLEAGPDALELENKTSDLEVAREVLAADETALAEAQAGPDTDRVALREAQLASALLAAEGAEENLADATVRSLYDGTVTEMMIESGDLVNRGQPVAIIVDRSVVEVVGSVDELDVLKVAEGAKATVALDALGGKALPGVVSFVAATPEQGQVVNYEFKVTIEMPEGVSLLEGLTATATVVTSRQSRVILVPNNAIGGSVIQPTVRVDSDGGIEERPVTLGQSDGFWTAVMAGLTEGEQVMIVSSSSQSQTESFGNIMRLAGAAAGNFPVGERAAPVGGKAPAGGGGK